MNVKEKTAIKKAHSIEWGEATWTENSPAEEKEKSIRNRYDKDDGGFNYAGSGEIPWTDFKEMIFESIKRGHFSKEELDEIYTTINLRKTE